MLDELEDMIDQIDREIARCATVEKIAERAIKRGLIDNMGVVRMCSADIVMVCQSLFLFANEAPRIPAVIGMLDSARAMVDERAAVIEQLQAEQLQRPPSTDRAKALGMLDDLAAILAETRAATLGSGPAIDDRVIDDVLEGLEPETASDPDDGVGDIAEESAAAAVSTKH